MKRIVSLAVLGLFVASVAPAASVPVSLKSKVASDSQLAAVRGGAAYGFGTINITLPSITVNPPTMPVVQFNPPSAPVVQITPVIVHNDGSITIQLPSIIITPPTAPFVVVTPPSAPLVQITPPSFSWTR